MPKLRGWTDVRLLSFDLQTVEFAYSRVVLSARGWCERLIHLAPNQDYALSITCSEGSYLFSFWRCDGPSSSDSGRERKDKTKTETETSPEQGELGLECDGRRRWNDTH
jgi:hypothetical protein